MTYMFLLCPNCNSLIIKKTRFFWVFTLKRLTGSVSISPCLASHPASVRTRTGPLDDGAPGAAAAGAGAVRQQFCLRDCRRCVHHHRPGDFYSANQLTTVTSVPLPGKLSSSS